MLPWVIGDEVRCSFFLFIAGTIALVVLYLTSFIGLIPMFVFFSVATTIMMAVNTVYVGVVPGYFAKKGLPSFSMPCIINTKHIKTMPEPKTNSPKGAFSIAFSFPSPGV